MYEVEFYYDKNGKSEIVDFLDELQAKSKTSKTDRINREKILTYIGALERFGTRIGKPINTLTAVYGSLDRFPTEYFSFIGKTISLCFCTTLSKRHRKHRRRSLNGQDVN